MGEYSYVTHMMNPEEFKGLYEKVSSQAVPFQELVKTVDGECSGVLIDMESIDSDTYGYGVNGLYEKWLVTLRSSSNAGTKIKVREYSRVHLYRVIETSTNKEVFKTYDGRDFDCHANQIADAENFSVDEFHDKYTVVFDEEDPYKHLWEQDKK